MNRTNNTVFNFEIESIVPNTSNHRTVSKSYSKDRPNAQKWRTRPQLGKVACEADRLKGIIDALEAKRCR